MKTNAARLLDPLGIAYEIREYEVDPDDLISFRTVNALVARDRRLLSLLLTLPKTDTTWRLVVREPKLVAGWLGG